MIFDYKPEFEIVCKTCQSTEVDIESTVGFSPTSGGWGSVDLICRKCRNYVEIWEPN